jgi:hypothetical protein
MTTEKDCRNLIRERLDFAAAGQEGQPVDCGAWSRTTPRMQENERSTSGSIYTTQSLKKQVRS